MRRRAASSRRELLPVKPCELRTLRRRQRRRRHAVLKALELDLVDVEDVRRPRRRFAVSERLACGLDVPRVVVAALDPRPPEPDRARARQPADLGRVSRAENEVLSPSSPAMNVCSCWFARWITQSSGRTSWTSPSCHASPEPASTKKTSSEAVCEWGGVGSIPGATRTRFTPTVRVPATWPSRCHVASISPFARRKPSTSSQCASVTTASFQTQRVIVRVMVLRTLRTSELTGARLSSLSPQAPEPLLLPPPQRPALSRTHGTPAPPLTLFTSPSPLPRLPPPFHSPRTKERTRIPPPLRNPTTTPRPQPPPPSLRVE